MIKTAYITEKLQKKMHQLVITVCLNRINQNLKKTCTFVCSTVCVSLSTLHSFCVLTVCKFQCNVWSTFVFSDNSGMRLKVTICWLLACI